MWFYSLQCCFSIRPILDLQTEAKNAENAVAIRAHKGIPKIIFKVN